MNSSIEIYSSQDGSIQLKVKLENDTVWLTQSQMAELFGVDRTSIVRHIRNIYKSEELDQNSTCAKNAQVRTEGHRSVLREIPYYNLDMIISVGYRVNSKNATSFRRWATSVLKQYLIKGYVINQQIKLDRYNELKDVVRLMSRTVGMQEKVTSEEYGGLFNVISDYVYALDTLDHYDYQSLSIQKTTKEELFRATYDNAMEAISALKEKFGGSQWFANEKDDSFKSSIGQIYQTFGGEDLYPSVEEKGCNVALPCSKEPFLQRWQQAHCRHAVPMVSQQQPCALRRGRPQAHSRQHPRCPHADDCREQDRGERCDGEGGGESD